MADQLYYLNRYDQEDGATFSMVTGPGLGVQLHAVELPWLDNRVKVSCIAPGTYEMVPTIFRPGKAWGYPAFEVVGVPGRTLIKGHRANWPQDLLGCIAPGMERTKRARRAGLSPTACVWRSKEAHDLWMASLRRHWNAGDRTFIEVSGTGL